jgi:hypothetical protein
MLEWGCVTIALDPWWPPHGCPQTLPCSPGSVKFISKVQYVHSLEELEQLIPMEHVQIPDCVLQ